MLRVPTLLIALLYSFSTHGAPDLDTLTAQVAHSLAQTGSGGQAGERIELHRSKADGWEMVIVAIWDGAAWQPLALRLHHAERSPSASTAWLERYQALLTDLRADHLDRLAPAQLFEVPPPDFLPIMPEEIRSRQFQFDGHWYHLSWLNKGGPNELARWALRSFELVAKPQLDLAQ